LAFKFFLQDNKNSEVFKRSIEIPWKSSQKKLREIQYLNIFLHLTFNGLKTTIFSSSFCGKFLYWLFAFYQEFIFWHFLSNFWLEILNKKDFWKVS
jgi:hypothetical protein